MAKKIRVDIPYVVVDGSEVTFYAPCDFAEAKELLVYYTDPTTSKETYKSFTFYDAGGNDLTSLKNLFAEGACVKAILSVTKGKAYIQNGLTNVYLENKLKPAYAGNYVNEFIEGQTDYYEITNFATNKYLRTDELYDGLEITVNPNADNNIEDFGFYVLDPDYPEYAPRKIVNVGTIIDNEFVDNIPLGYFSKDKPHKLTYSGKYKAFIFDYMQHTNTNVTYNTKSTDGILYTTTIEGLPGLYEGLEIIIIPNKTAKRGASISAYKLKVNDFAYYPIYSLFQRTDHGVPLDTLAFPSDCIKENKPVRLRFSDESWLVIDYPINDISTVTGILSPTNGGTGLEYITKGNFLVGNDYDYMVEKTPEEVLSIIGGSKVVKGSYTGDGTMDRIIEVGFTPKLVIIEHYGNSSHTVFIKGEWGTMGIFAGSYYKDGQNIQEEKIYYTRGTTTKNGFKLRDSRNIVDAGVEYEDHLRENGTNSLVYRYVAIG